MFLIFLILGGPDPKIEGGPGPPWPPPLLPPWWWDPMSLHGTPCSCQQPTGKYLIPGGGKSALNSTTQILHTLTKRKKSFLWNAMWFKLQSIFMKHAYVSVANNSSRLQYSLIKFHPFITFFCDTRRPAEVAETTLKKDMKCCMNC